MTTQFKVHFGDFAGDDEATETFYFAGTVTDPEAGSPSSLILALEAFSGAAIAAGVLLPTDNVVIGTAVAGPYGSIEDKMELKFKTSTGLKTKYKVPAPTATCFLPSTDFVNDADAAVIAVKAAIIAVAKGSDGSALTYVSGSRVRTKRHKPK